MRSRQSDIKVRVIFLSLVLSFGTLFSCLAQDKIVFKNNVSGKVIKARLGDQISVRYKGYLGQTESYKHTLTEIYDSSFVLGVNFMGPDLSQAKEIQYKDIIAFRRMSLGRVFLKSTLSLGSAVATIIVLDRLYKEQSLSFGQRIGVSLGVGLGVNILINAILSEKPKYQVKDGWE
ncbi:MAG: hypothetical protein MH472_11420, partial [Bacteroidia bacterium]|nr:hypothetical protein [Bacteroidia bacterium]